MSCILHHFEYPSAVPRSCHLMTIGRDGAGTALHTYVHEPDDTGSETFFPDRPRAQSVILNVRTPQFRDTGRPENGANG